MTPTPSAQQVLLPRSQRRGRRGGLPHRLAAHPLSVLERWDVRLHHRARVLRQAPQARRSPRRTRQKRSTKVLNLRQEQSEVRLSLDREQRLLGRGQFGRVPRRFGDHHRGHHRRLPTRSSNLDPGSSHRSRQATGRRTPNVRRPSCALRPRWSFSTTRTSSPTVGNPAWKAPERWRSSFTRLASMCALILTRFGGQFDYAARAAT